MCGDVRMTVKADDDPLLEDVVVVELGHSCVRSGLDSIPPLPPRTNLMQSAVKARTL